MTAKKCRGMNEDMNWTSSRAGNPMVEMKGKKWLRKAYLWMSLYVLRSGNTKLGEYRRSF